MHAPSNYPPGMTARDMDYVEGVDACTLCPVCSQELSWNEEAKCYPCLDDAVFLDEYREEMLLSVDELETILIILNKGDSNA